MRHIKDLKHLERKGEPGQGAKRRHPHGHPTKRRQPGNAEGSMGKKLPAPGWD